MATPHTPAVPLPSRLVVNKRAQHRSAFAERLPTIAPHRSGSTPPDATTDDARTFVDSLPIAMLMLECASSRVKTECDAVFGTRAHCMTGKAWAPPNASTAGAGVSASTTGASASTTGASASTTGASASTTGASTSDAPHVELLARKMPWLLLQADGAGDVLDPDYTDDNPHVVLSVPRHESARIHADVSVRLHFESKWTRAATRVRIRDASFPTSDAMLIKTRPREWSVPSTYENIVSRVIARVEDATTDTRFWVIAPVKSARMRPTSREWFQFCSQVTASAAASTVVRGVRGVLAPILPHMTHYNRIPGLIGLTHACVSPPTTTAHIVDATMTAFVRMTEGSEQGPEPDADEEEEEEKASDDPSERALAFAPHDDLFIAVCDTRVAFPLFTFVVKNQDLRAIDFRDPTDDASNSFVVDWGMISKHFVWASWNAEM